MVGMEPKGCIHAAMAFALMVETLNIRARGKRLAKAHERRGPSLMPHARSIAMAPELPPFLIHSPTKEFS